jgi:predicted lipoprotein with Yx(FWY)xxD motif
MNSFRRWLVIVPVVAVLAACGGTGTAGNGGGTSGGTGGSRGGAGDQTQVKAAMVTIGGKSQSVLTDGSGKTLYYFLADSGGKMACSGSCAKEWKPLMVPAGAKPMPGQGVTGQLSTMAATDGTVATYNGWPLYTYIGDTGAGTATGEGVDDFGGQWFAVRVDVRPNPGAAASPGTSPGAPAPAPTPTPSSDYGY